MKFTKLVSALMLAGLLAACTPDNVKDDDSSTDGSNQGSNQTNADGAKTGGLNGDGSANGTALNGATVSYDKAAINDANNVLAEKVIYFNYDSDQISPDYQELITHHGKYLASNPDMSVRLEGHADERGSREYNVALANRRAQSVRRLVLFQGVNADQVSVISYGEEKPVALGHDDEAWRLNRRVELVYEAR
ncbi:MAG: peptidoglycan-associated lipoprotein Pal [endosymbiont of Galathealinum brachiosum]|uniref:Peptidoglycan-associated lipoprotein n=1 Tax=endosymbiont of Galathealinum brachiosum TaxID=2200906 RepID=A0A370DKL0_9GAMM|nr:MAG: peptidoglycan-associated lipoprotein Pal [endosymbiont of Galathealinum brachiosum]